MFLLGVHFAVAAVSSVRTSPAAPGRPDPAPDSRARELLRRASHTRWHRELRAASAHVKRRERRRRIRYNDYLPEDAPGALLSSLDVEGQDPYGPAPECLSPLQRWFVSLILSMGVQAWDRIEAYNVTSLAYLYKHHVSGDDSDEYFGTYGDRTDEMRANHASLVDFWSPGGEVVLLGMHGVDLADGAKLVATLQQMYGMEGREAMDQAGTIQRLVQTLPGAFNNPVLTANAVAMQSAHPDGTNEERDSIIVGDGVFAFLEWLDLSGDGPYYIHSHEFGHHLQYDLEVEHHGDGWTAGEETRRWETMADAFGGYYLAHAGGARMGSDRLRDVHRAAFALGDCEDEVGNHHGTPKQRECASNYGANLAVPSYLDGGHRMRPAELRRLFDEDYPRILGLWEGHCEAVVDAELMDRAIYGEGAAAPSASPGAGAPQVEYPAYEPFDAPSQQDWGVPFEAYDPNEESLLDELDEPPPRVRINGTRVEDGGWFGSTASQWRMPRSKGARSDVGLAMVAAVTWNILLNLA